MTSKQIHANLLPEKSGGNASSDFAPFTTAYELSQVWKQICKSDINVKVENFNACHGTLGLSHQQ